MADDRDSLRERLKQAEERLRCVEEQNAELFGRLTVTETALGSACEARDAAVRLLDEIRRELTGPEGEPPGPDLVSAVRRLTARAR